MRKIHLVCLYSLFYSSGLAQKEIKIPAAQYIKISSKDSLVKLPEHIKNQLSRIFPQENKVNKNLRLLLAKNNKNESMNAGRWIAARQQQDIYQVSLSGLVSKYIGETEKNLEQVFSRAEAKNWILYFDEADDLFGKRTETNTAEEQERNKTIEFFIKKLNGYKGTVLVSCSGEDCLGKLAGLNFLKIGG